MNTMHIVPGATSHKEEVKKTVEIFEGTDQKGRKVELRVIDEQTYVYRLNGNLMDSGQVYAQYTDCLDPADYGLEATEGDEDATVVECVPGNVEDPDSGSNYRFIFSERYKLLVVE